MRGFFWMWLWASFCLALIGCKAPALGPGAPGLDLPACPAAPAGSFPLYPGAVEDRALAGVTTLGSKRVGFSVYQVDRPLKHVLAFYQKCLGTEASRESEDGSYHFERASASLTLSGSPKRTLIRLSKALP